MRRPHPLSQRAPEAATSAALVRPPATLLPVSCSTPEGPTGAAGADGCPRAPGSASDSLCPRRGSVLSEHLLSGSMLHAPRRCTPRLLGPFAPASSPLAMLCSPRPAGVDVRGDVPLHPVYRRVGRAVRSRSRPCRVFLFSHLSTLCFRRCCGTRPRDPVPKEAQWTLQPARRRTTATRMPPARRRAATTRPRGTAGPRSLLSASAAHAASSAPAAWCAPVVPCLLLPGRRPGACCWRACCWRACC